MNSPTQPRLHLRRAKLTELHQDPANARTHDEKNLSAIAASLKQFGQVEPLVVQKATGKVIGGNGRLEVLKRTGATEVDIVEVEVNDTQATALGIALNRTGELAAWDDGTLAKLLESLPEEDFAATGFSDEDLQGLLDTLAPLQVTEDETPAPPKAATTRASDRWILGEHALLCGDSARDADVDRLLGGLPVHLVNTDPPYNVRVEPRGNAALLSGSGGLPSLDQSKRLKNRTLPKNRDLAARDRTLKNDFLSDEEFERRLSAWFANIARTLIPGGGFYIWGGSTNCGNYPPALKEAGLFFHQGVIWVKEHPALTRRDFMSNHEWCFYGWKEGAAHRFFGPANIPDVWSIKKISPQAMIHLTEKPVELAARAIQYSSRRGEHVLDLFGGSGSTLIAAEQTGRRAFLMELDPLYADVIVLRWQKLTGREAVLDGDGRSFEQVSAERLNTPEKDPEELGVEGEP